MCTTISGRPENKWHHTQASYPQQSWRQATSDNAELWAAVTELHKFIKWKLEINTDKIWAIHLITVKMNATCKLTALSAGCSFVNFQISKSFMPTFSFKTHTNWHSAMILEYSSFNVKHCQYDWRLSEYSAKIFIQHIIYFFMMKHVCTIHIYQWNM